MKNYTTPRNFADCSWTTGYQSAQFHREANWNKAHWAIYTVGVCGVSFVLYLISTGA